MPGHTRVSTVWFSDFSHSTIVDLANFFQARTLHARSQSGSLESHVGGDGGRIQVYQAHRGRAVSTWMDPHGCTDIRQANGGVRPHQLVRIPNMLIRQICKDVVSRRSEYPHLHASAIPLSHSLDEVSLRTGFHKVLLILLGRDPSLIHEVFDFEDFTAILSNIGPTDKSTVQVNEPTPSSIAVANLLDVFLWRDASSSHRLDGGRSGSVDHSADVVLNCAAVFLSSTAAMDNVKEVVRYLVKSLLPFVSDEITASAEHPEPQSMQGGHRYTRTETRRSSLREASNSSWPFAYFTWKLAQESSQIWSLIFQESGIVAQTLEYLAIREALAFDDVKMSCQIIVFEYQR